jgi:hypothetical protein
MAATYLGIAGLAHVTIAYTRTAPEVSQRCRDEDEGVRRLKPYVIDLGLVFVVVVWVFSPNVFKFALSELRPLAFVFVRFVLLCIVATLALAWRGARGGAA